MWFIEIVPPDNVIEGFGFHLVRITCASHYVHAYSTIFIRVELIMAAETPSTRLVPCTISSDKAEELVKNGKPLDRLNPYVLAVANNMVVKFGSGIYRSEAIAMQFIRDESSITVPRVISYTSSSSLLHPGSDCQILSQCGYLFMERMPGVTLKSVLGHLNEDQKKAIARDLCQVVKKLCCLDQPKTWGMIGKDGAYHGGSFSHTYSEEPCRPSPLHPVSNIMNWLTRLF